MVSAKIIADSVSPSGDRITTFELEYPRFIHSEFMTHRLFSRNAMSSRAVPIEKMIEQVKNDPAMPVVWGKNQAGMQAKEVFECDYDIATCEFLWRQGARAAVDQAKKLKAKGLHKQIVNRVLEPFQTMKVVVTSTEWDNFFYLRCHKDAQPEIRVLADKMYEVYSVSVPIELKIGDWHTPYFELSYFDSDWSSGADINGTVVTLEDALKISASCCAQVSFRKSDDSLDKAAMIYDRLVESKPVHASPFEHQAKVMESPNHSPALGIMEWEKGVTHADNNGKLWSGNFKGWIQHRQLIKNNACWEYKPNAI